MVDKDSGEDSLRSAWSSIGRRVAVAGGCLVGLISLFHHVPASTAALRGGAAWLAVLVLAKFSGFVLGHAYRFDVARDREQQEKQRS